MFIRIWFGLNLLIILSSAIIYSSKSVAGSPKGFEDTVARSYTAQISIGKSGMDTTNAHSQKQRCIEFKHLLGGQLSLRNYNAQVGESYSLNKLTGLSVPETCRID